MQEAEAIGMLVVCLGTLFGLFKIVQEPINKNTSAMTELATKVEQLTKQLEKQENELNVYKVHVDESQRRQWDVINEHDAKLVEHNVRLEALERKGE